MKSFISLLSSIGLKTILTRWSYDELTTAQYRDANNTEDQANYAAMARERDEGLEEDEGLLEMWMRLVEPSQLFYQNASLIGNRDFNNLRLALHPTIAHFVTSWFGTETMGA